MANFRHGAGIVVAGDVRDAVAAFDGALLSGARMCVSVLEAANGAGVPIVQSQKVLRALSTGMTSVVDGRGEIVSAIRQMNAIKSASNVRMEDYGCPDGAASAMPITATDDERLPA